MGMHMSSTDTHTFRRRILAIFAATAVVAGGFAAAPAVAAEPEPDLTVELEGVVRVLPDESGKGGPNLVTLHTESGAEIELTGADVDGIATGSTFQGTVAVEATVADAVAEADTIQEVEEAVAQEQTEPVEVIDAVIEPPLAAAVSAATHTVDVMWLGPAGTAPALADVDAFVARMSDFWKTQSNGQVAAITRPQTYRSAVVSDSVYCNASAAWDYAAGKSGFNRTGLSGQGAQSYYWGNGNRTHLLVLVHGTVCGAGSGLGTVGTVHAGGVVWASVAATPTWWDQVAFHEIGHNLGLGHSNMLDCPQPKVEGSGCAIAEYEDFYDVMGGGMTFGGISNFHNIASLNISHKVNLDAAPRTGTPALKTVTTSGGGSQTFTINANGLDTGLRGLEIINPDTGQRTFVEYRGAVGRDETTWYKRVRTKTAEFPEGIRILRLDCATHSCAGKTSTVLRTPNGRYAYTAGQTFTGADSKGDALFQVKVISTEPNTATVEVVFPKVLGLTLEGPTPTVTGVAKVGLPLTVIPGAWEPGVTLKYQWRVAGAAVSGATGTTFTPRGADAGKQVTVTVTGTLDGISGSKTSDPTELVQVGDLAAVIPSITGTPAVGATLTANPGAWTTGTTFTYQWAVGGIPVSGATAKTFAPRPADMGLPVSVTVTGKLAGYTSVTLTSPATPLVEIGTLTAPVPTISGTVKYGSTLTAVPGTWTKGAALKYQWAVAGANVTGATASTFKPTAAHVGKSVTVTVTGTLTGYTSASKTSKATGAVAAAALTAPTPTISGTAKVGTKLTAKPGTWTKGTALKYQWYVGGKAVSGATASTFTPTGSHAGKTVVVKVTGTLSGYTTTTKGSKATKAVAKGTMKPAAPKISGTKKVGKTLTAKPAAGTGLKYKYQWYVSGKKISGATKVTFKIRKADKGKTIRVKVTYSKTGYTSVTKTSAATSKVKK